MSLLGPESEVPFSVVEKLPHILLRSCVVVMSENCTNIPIYNDANTVCSGERQLKLQSGALTTEPQELWHWTDN